MHHVIQSLSAVIVCCGGTWLANRTHGYFQFLCAWAIHLLPCNLCAITAAKQWRVQSRQRHGNITEEPVGCTYSRALLHQFTVCVHDAKWIRGIGQEQLSTLPSELPRYYDGNDHSGSLCRLEQHTNSGGFVLNAFSSKIQRKAPRAAQKILRMDSIIQCKWFRNDHTTCSVLGHHLQCRF